MTDAEHDVETTLLTPISNAFTLSMAKKCSKISNLLMQCENELDAHLQQFCSFAVSSGGLISDDYRQRIWPVLARNIPIADHGPRKSFLKSCLEDGSELNQPHHEDIDGTNFSVISDSDFESAHSAFSTDDEIETQNTATHQQKQKIPLHELQSHPEWRQVELDVVRTLARFPPDIGDEEREKLQRQLTPLIVNVMCQNENFHYYQGFHDVCLTFLLVLGAEEAANTVQSLCERGAFRNYLSFPLEESVLRDLDDLYVLLFLHDHEIEKRMRSLELGTLFALSWPLTWFSHALQHHSQVALFFDLLLCSDYLMPIYVSAALICERREEILVCEQEMPMLHKLLNHVPAGMNCNRIISTARMLYGRYPPAVLHELKKEYEQMCGRQRRQKDIIEKLDQTQVSNLVHARRGSVLRMNVYEFARSFAVYGGVAALAVVYYYSRKGPLM